MAQLSPSLLIMQIYDDDDEIDFGPIFFLKNILCQKKFEKKNSVQKIFWLQIFFFGLKTKLGPKIFGSEKKVWKKCWV